jgi:hypothetical protein
MPASGARRSLRRTHDVYSLDSIQTATEETLF